MPEEYEIPASFSNEYEAAECLARSFDFSQDDEKVARQIVETISKDYWQKLLEHCHVIEDMGMSCLGTFVGRFERYMQRFWPNKRFNREAMIMLVEHAEEMIHNEDDQFAIFVFLHVVTLLCHPNDADLMIRLAKNPAILHDHDRSNHGGISEWLKKNGLHKNLSEPDHSRTDVSPAAKPFQKNKASVNDLKQLVKLTANWSKTPQTLPPRKEDKKMANFIEAKAREMLEKIDFEHSSEQELIEAIGKQLEGSHDEMAMSKFAQFCREVVSDGKAQFTTLSREGFEFLNQRARHYYDHCAKSFQTLWIAHIFLNLMVAWCAPENAGLLGQVLNWPGFINHHYSNFWPRDEIEALVKKYN